MLPLLLGGLAAAGGIGKLFNAGKQEKNLTNLVNSAGEYKADPNVKGNVSLAKNLFNSTSGGATLAQQTILGNQANAMDAVERGATDSGQVLAMANALNASTNDAIIKNAEADRRDQASRFGMVQSAVDANADEGARVWADKLRRLNQMLGIKATKHANIDTAIGDIIGGAGMSIGSKGQGGLFDILKLG